MNIFTHFSFYLALLGLILTVIYGQITRKDVHETVIATKPSSSPYRDMIAATGIVETVGKNTLIGSPEEGVVYKIWVNPGDTVKKNDRLFQLDPRSLEDKLAVQKASMNVEKNSFEKQQNRLERLKTVSVSDPRAVSVDELETLQDDVLVAHSKFLEAKAKADEIEGNLERLTIRSPGDGVILQQDIRVGEFLNRDKAAFIFGDLEHLHIRVSIDEYNASYFKKDDPAVAFPKNNSAEMIPLHFESVEPLVIPKKSLTGLGQEKVDTRVLQVIYSFDAPRDYTIYVGQQMDVFIQKPTTARTNAQK